MLQHIHAVENEDDRKHALERVAELTGCTEQSPEEVELIMLTLALELWELRQRTDAMPAVLEFPKSGQPARNAHATRQLSLHQSRRRLRCVPSRTGPH